MEKEQKEKKGTKLSRFFDNFLFPFVFTFFAMIGAVRFVGIPVAEFLSEKTGIFYEEFQSADINAGIAKATVAASNKVNFRAEKARKKFARKYDTTAAWQLDTEYDAYPTLNQNHYKIIDDAIDYVKSEIGKQRNWESLSEKKRASIVFAKTHDFIKKYRENSSASGETLLSRGLDKKNLDCDTGSVIYFAIGEALVLPIVTVHVPETSTPKTGHVFVRWNCKDGTYLNWETVEGQFKSDAGYQKWLGNDSLKIEPIVMDSNGYRKEWRQQLHFAYEAKDAESIIKSITVF